VSLKAAVTTVKTKGHDCFDLLAAPAGSGALADADAIIAEKLMEKLRRATGYDRILIDLGAGISDPTLTIASISDDAVVVMTPDPAALTDAYAFVKLMLKRTGGRAPSILVNMAANTGEAKRTAEALTNSARNFLKSTPAYLGFVPADSRVVECIRRQTSLWTAYPNSPALEAISGMTGRLGGQAVKVRASGSMR
jgi:flagellar biosynthesis protein FlhG